MFVMTNLLGSTLHARFFERIAKTYRRERWDFMLNPLLTTWFACARQMGDMEMSVKLLLEMLGHGLGFDFWNMFLFLTY